MSKFKLSKGTNRPAAFFQRIGAGSGSDGTSTVTRSFEIQVANFNQAPRILPMPLQLVSEGELLSFTLRTADADADAVRTTLIYDENIPFWCLV